jgi:hypothetical protein
MNWVWLGWLFAFAVSFAAIEGWAIHRGQTTLSRFTWTISQAWPPLPFVLGLIAGGLAVHFWWHWCP